MTESTIVIEDIAGLNKVVKNVRITGQLDESNVDEKIQIIYKIFETNPKGVNIIFDLEALDYMNSKSVGYLTDLYGKVTEGGGTVAIAKPKPNITDILQVVGLTQLIKTFDSTEEAKKYISENGTPAPAVVAPATPATAAPATINTTTTTTTTTTPAPAAIAPATPAVADTPAVAVPVAVTSVPAAPIIPTPVAPVAPAPIADITITAPAPTATPAATPAPAAPTTPQS